MSVSTAESCWIADEIAQTRTRARTHARMLMHEYTYCAYIQDATLAVSRALLALVNFENRGGGVVDANMDGKAWNLERAERMALAATGEQSCLALD